MIPHRYVYHISLAVALWILVFAFFRPFTFPSAEDLHIPQLLHDPQPTSAAPEAPAQDAATPTDELNGNVGGDDIPPAPEPTLIAEQPQLAKPTFDGPFERFPRLSELDDKHRRLSVILIWIGDDNPTYLRHHLHQIQLNADSLDLLFLNRKTKEKTNCLDFEKVGLNVTWGGNIKVACIDDAEYKRRHVDFLCGKEHGWNCNEQEYKDVMKEFESRRDTRSHNWKLFRGWVFRDLLAHPQNPFWAWMDPDVIPGNFRRYPFNLLSQLSFLTGDSAAAGTYFMLMGQLTAFNFEDPELGSVWKKFPEMKTPAHFTKYIDGRFPNEPEELYWSHGYMPSDPGRPGEGLSWGIYPNIHGDDYFDNQWRKYKASETFVISGRDMLLLNVSYTREEIETLIEMDRNDPIDDLGGVGWTTGGDAIVTEDILKTNCSDDSRKYSCVDKHPLTISEPPVFRPTWIRFKDQAPNVMWRRLERDLRPRGYERKLFRHHLFSKKQSWWEFPPMEITEDLVYRYNMDSSEVWKMGPTRNKTLWYRKRGEKPIG